MRVTTAVLGIVTLTFLVSDIFHAEALRAWNRGEAERGMRLIQTADLINPYSLNVRLDEIESLYAGYRKTKNSRYLEEVRLISRALVRNYPGSAQAWAVYAGANVFQATHPGSAYVDLNGLPDQVFKAIELDPLSVSAIERVMFLCAALRMDHKTFLRLGKKRAMLTSKPLVMKCELCGRPWLDHKYPALKGEQK